MPRSALLIALDLLPVLAHRAGRGRLPLAEHVRVAADQLLGDAGGHHAQVALPVLLAQEREEERLEQQVAELVEQLRAGAGARRLGHLVGLLDRVRHDRRHRLLAIPGTVVPQALGEALQAHHRVGQEQALERGTGRHGLVPGPRSEQPPQALARRGGDRRAGGQRDAVGAQPLGERLVVGQRDRPSGLERPEGRERDQVGVTRSERDERRHEPESRWLRWSERWPRRWTASTASSAACSPARSA